MTYKVLNTRIATILTIILASIFAVSYTASANPSFFIRANSLATCSTPTATTSISYMTAGLATTTYSFDTGCAAAGSVDSAVLTMQFTASSTASKLHIDYEYSQDAITWYQSNLSDQATTTATQDISAEQDYNWNFASSTEGFGAVTNTNRANKVIKVPTPTRYVRAVFSVPVGAAAGGVWAEFVAKRQAN